MATIVDLIPLQVHFKRFLKEDENVFDTINMRELIGIKEAPNRTTNCIYFDLSCIDKRINVLNLIDYVNWIEEFVVHFAEKTNPNLLNFFRVYSTEKNTVAMYRPSDKNGHYNSYEITFNDRQVIIGAEYLPF